jgi:hypothetical protein
MAKLNMPQISMEAIAYQKQSLLVFDVLSVLQQLRSLPVIDQVALDSSGLAEIVKRRTGLSIRFVVNVPSGKVDQALPPVFTTNAAEMALMSTDSPLYKLVSGIAPLEAAVAVTRFHQALRLADTLSGSIDLKNGLVTGVFSQLPCVIWLDGFTLHAQSPATVEEATALIIHEIGHVFSCFETILHTTITNAIVSTALEALRTTDTPEQKVKLVLQAINAYGGERSDAEVIAAEESEDTQRILFLKTFETYAQFKLHTQLGTQNTANYRSVEFLADQYAVRHGLTLPLASALHKLFKIEQRNYAVSAARFYSVEAARYSLMLVGLFTPVWPVAAVVGMICVMLGAASAEADDYAPSPLERLGGIKKDLVQLLKDQSTPPTTRKQLLQSVEFVDTLRLEAKSHDSLARFVWKNFYPNGRRQVKIREFQKGLEDLINNDLYIHAQRLNPN